MQAKPDILCVAEKHLKTVTCVFLPLYFPLSAPPIPYQFKQTVSPFLISSGGECGKLESKYGLLVV